MESIGPRAIRHPLGIESSTANNLFFATLAIIMMLTLPAQGEPETMPVDKRITIQQVFPDTKGGFGYMLEYCVAAPIEAVWHPNTSAVTWLHWKLNREGAYNHETG